MEKKTLGSFLTALRKANGMTQKDLADRLNVSDKAVSRWERDENYPDLALLPVIADLFGVTTDELLRGERRTGDAAVSTERSERQLQYLVDTVTFRYIAGSLIAISVVICCFILQLVCIKLTSVFYWDWDEVSGFVFVYGEVSERVIRMITTTILFGAWIAACLFVGLSYWTSHRKLSAADDSEIAAAGKRKIRKAFLSEAVFLIAFIPLVISVGIPDFTSDLVTGLGLFSVIFVIGTVLLSPLPKRLRSFLSLYPLKTEKTRKVFARKTVILSVLSVLIWGTVIFLGESTNGAFFGPGRWFFNKQSFCNYMSEECEDDEARVTGCTCRKLIGKFRLYESIPTAGNNNRSEYAGETLEGSGIRQADLERGYAYRIGEEESLSFEYRNGKADTVILSGNPSMLPIRTFTKTGRDIGFAVWFILCFAIPSATGAFVFRIKKKLSLTENKVTEMAENDYLS